MDIVHTETGTSAPALVAQPLLQHSEWLDDGARVPTASEGQPADPAMSLVKRTYQPSVIVRKRRHGFLSRLRSKGGQRVLERRRLKGRWKKSA
jgi:large subunit ribosomal protein L34